MNRPPRSSRAIRLLALVLAALLIAAGCSGDDDDDDASDGTGGDDTTDDSVGEPQAGGTLQFGLAAETGGWNPAQDQFSLSSYQVAQAIYDRLVAYDENDVAQPYLAESFEANEDFTEWTFTLREGVTFHDGTPLDAEVLALNFTETKESPLLGQVFQAVETIEVVDDLTVLVTMNTPWASFPHTLTAQPGLIVAPSVFEEGGNREPVGTGPFVFDEWVEDNHLTVSRNDGYWREGYPLLDGIEFQILTDPLTRSATLESGEVDMIEARSASEIVSFEESGDFDVYLDEQGETTEAIANLNLAKAPFDDPLAREAVAYGLDRQTMSDTVYAGRFPPADDGPFMEGSPWRADGLEYPTYDPERAQAAADAYEEAHGEPITFVLTTTPNPISLEVAALIDEMLSAYGIEVEVETVEATAGIVGALSGDFQMGVADALWGSTHPDREYTFIHSSNVRPIGEMGTNFTRVNSEDIDEGMTAARATDDPAAQAEGWAQVQQGLIDELPFIFLVHVQVGTVASPNVEDVTNWTLPGGEPGLPQEQNVVPVYQLWFSED